MVGGWSWWLVLVLVLVSGASFGWVVGVDVVVFDYIFGIEYSVAYFSPCSFTCQ